MWDLEAEQQHMFSGPHLLSVMCHRPVSPVMSARTSTVSTVREGVLEAHQPTLAITLLLAVQEKSGHLGLSQDEGPRNGGQWGLSAHQTDGQQKGQWQLLLWLEGHAPSAPVAPLSSSISFLQSRVQPVPMQRGPSPLQAAGQVAWVWPGCRIPDLALEGLPLPCPTLPSNMLR